MFPKPQAAVLCCPPWQFPRPIIHGLILCDCHSLLSPEVTSLIHPRCLPLGMGLSFDSGIIIPPCAQSSLGPGTSAGCTRMQNACPPEVFNLMISFWRSAAVTRKSSEVPYGQLNTTGQGLQAWSHICSSSLEVYSSLLMVQS